MAAAVGAPGCGGPISIVGDLGGLKKSSVIEVWTVSGCGRTKDLKVEIGSGAGVFVDEMPSTSHAEQVANPIGERNAVGPQVENAIGRFKPLAAMAKGFHPNGFGHPYWLDNHRILLEARRLKLGATDDGQWDSYERARLFIWDIEANTFIPTNVPASQYAVDCFNSDTHYIQIPIEKNRTDFPYMHGVLEGDIGEYKLVDYVNQSNNRYINPYSCRDYLGISNKLIPNQVSDPLLERHGILHFDVVKKVAYDGWFELRLTTPDNQTAKFEMTLAEYHFSPPYSAIAQSYVFSGRLYRRGELSKGEIESNSKKHDTFSLLSPYPPFSINYLHIPSQLMQIGVRNEGIPPSILKTGAIIWYYQPMDKPSRGAYLQEGERVSKILDGYQTYARVSPDGCKLAYNHGSGRQRTATHNPRDFNRLEVIDFCKAKE